MQNFTDGKSFPPLSLSLAQSHSKIIENDLLVFLQFYFVLAKNSIENIYSDITQAKDSLNFWQNFAQNFKDESFIKLLQSQEDIERTKFIQKKVEEIINKILEFFTINCSNQGKKKLFLFFYLYRKVS